MYTLTRSSQTVRRMEIRRAARRAYRVAPAPPPSSTSRRSVAARNPSSRLVLRSCSSLHLLHQPLSLRRSLPGVPSRRALRTLLAPEAELSLNPLPSTHNGWTICPASPFDPRCCQHALLAQDVLPAGQPLLPGRPCLQCAQRFSKWKPHPARDPGLRLRYCGVLQPGRQCSAGEVSKSC